MTVRIKEVVVRYEDDGQTSTLSKEEHLAKYRPLQMIIHHHCSPPPVGGTALPAELDKAQEIRIDLTKER